MKKWKVIFKEQAIFDLVLRRKKGNEYT